jgi:hypothetical protein
MSLTSDLFRFWVRFRLSVRYRRALGYSWRAAWAKADKPLDMPGATVTTHKLKG